MARKKTSNINLGISMREQRKRDYIKARASVLHEIHLAEKRGFLFSADVLPPPIDELKRLPTEAQINKLRNLTGSKKQELYKRSAYVSELTQGEVVRGTKGLKLEQQQKEKIEKFNKKNVAPTIFETIIITNFRNNLFQWNIQFRNLMNEWLDMVIREYGEVNVARMLNEAEQNGCVITFQIAYSVSKARNYLAQMMNYLPNISEEFKRQVYEAFELDDFVDESVL